MAPLELHEAVLDLEGPPDMRPGRGTVAFSAPHIGATRVELDVVRWMDMGHPRQVVVAIRPIPKRRPT